MLVMTAKEFVCVKIIGRANFTSSIDFKTLVNGLLEKGFGCFALDLSECVLMDSTFLGVLAGFGLRMSEGNSAPESPAIQLLNPNRRIVELLENLGVLNLFKLVEGQVAVPAGAETHAPSPSQPGREEVKQTCLQAHKTLMEINPENISKFKDVAQFLAEDMKKLQKAQP